VLTDLFTRARAATSNQNTRLFFLLFSIAVAVFVLQGLLMICLPLAGFMAHTAPDDAFYYLEIARRHGDPAWPTFDGQHTTTGFHPLWQLLLVPIARIGSPWLFARVAVAISALLMFAAAVQCTRIVARSEGLGPALVVGILIFGAAGTIRFGLNGMETPLGLFLLCSWCMEASRPAPRSTRAGLLAGLTVLARIDMIWPLAIGHCWLLFRDRKKWQPWLIAMLVSAAVLLPFVVWNIVNTGHIGTISAATKLYATEEFAKTSFGGKASLGFAIYAAKNIFANIGNIAAFWGRGFVYAPSALAIGGYPLVTDLRSNAGMIFMGMVLLGALGLVLARKVDTREPLVDPDPASRPFFMWVFVGGSSLHLAACSLLIPGQTGTWYWGLEIGAAAVLCGRMFSNLARARKPIVAFAIANTVASVIIVAMTATTLIRGGFDHRKSFGSAAIEVAKYLDHVAETGVVAGSRNGGIIGFVADRPIVNLDGLVNDWEFFEARRRGEVRTWIQRHHVRYYGDCVSRAAQPDYAKSLGLLPNEVTTVFRVEGHVCEGFVWRIDLPEVSPANSANGFTHLLGSEAELRQ
jgi:hypothetical protein